MKYKVGDKVLIKSRKWYLENNEGEFLKWVSFPDGTVVGMARAHFCGQVMTIEHIGIDSCNDEYYLFVEDKEKMHWNDYMIECKVEEPKSKFKIGDKVIVSDTSGIWEITDMKNDTLYSLKRENHTATLTTYGGFLSLYEGILGETIESKVEEETKPKDMGEVSDGYHTFNELYEYRMLYNAALFNEFAKQGLYDVHKSRKHSDGEYPFGDSNWFIVMAELPTGQISNHYEMKDWDKFQIPEKEMANKWDGHSPRDVADRLISFTNYKNEIKNTIGKLEVEPICDVYDTCYGTRAPSNFELMDKINELIDEINRLKNEYKK